MKRTMYWLVMWTALVGGVSAEWQPLWPEGAPGGVKPPEVVEAVNPRGGFAETSVPGYWVYPADPANNTGVAVVIFPGGGYGMLAMNHEGHAYAKWLNERGITGVVVKYRVSRHAESGFQYPLPYLDARRAIRLTREHAAQWGVDVNKVGVMGSSAGGHLASMCVTLFDQSYEMEGEGVASSRPDFGILVYPVIGMDQDWGHAGSRRNLLGPDHTDEQARELATYRRVTAQTPPCFLVHAADDKPVPVRNSLEFAAACAGSGVPVVCQVVAEGGHGFGLGGGGDSSQWTAMLETWLEGKPWARSDD